MPVHGTNSLGNTFKGMLPDMTKRSTQIKVAVLVAGIILTGIVLAVAFDNLGKDLFGPVHKHRWWKWGIKRNNIAGAFLGVCLLQFGLGLANGYVFGKKIPFDEQLELFKKLGLNNQRGLSTVTTEAGFINALKSLDEETMNSIYLKKVDESADSDKMSTIRSLIKRCGSGEFKNKSEDAIVTIIANERRRAEQLYTAAKILLVAVVILSLIMIGLSFSNLAYVKSGYYSSLRLNLGVFVTGGVASTVAGLTSGYLYGRRKMNYKTVGFNNASMQ